MDRYHRQMMVDKLGVLGQDKLISSHVAVVGLGGLGSPLCLYLAGAGVGKLTLVDHDDVSLTNLHRQVLYREHDTNQSKAEIAKKTLSELNGQIEIVSSNQPVNASNIDDMFDGVDVIVDAADNFAISYLLSDYAYEHHKPLVSASVMQTYGYVGVYCYSSFSQKVLPSMRAIFSHPPDVGVDCNSVGVIGTSAGIIAMLQAQEVIKVIVGDKEQLAGKLLNFDCWNYRQSIIDFNSAPEPNNKIHIVASANLTNDDWVIDVRTVDEAEKDPKVSDQHIPLKEMNVKTLPKDKRLIFICASGQRALYAADKALQNNFENVGICF
ncbi:MAG: HesA/MoeB/ThiF family protein [Gammaproteobacteria bacterium]|nr:HesA/MoeB/ThiF family protein [Gammaproteobacteria bacterium]